MKKLLALILILSLAMLSACDITESIKSYECRSHNDLDFNGFCDTCGGNMGVTNGGTNGGTSGGTNGGTSGGTNGGTSANSCSSHTDSDDNGVCDSCASSVLVNIDFYSVNDLHGKFSDTDIQPGVDELTTYFKMASSGDKNAVILSAGDLWQGGAESNLTNGRIVTDWMNNVGFASMTLGNHEYDWGEEYIEANAELANFPFLAINVYEKSTGKRVEYAEASVIVERDGVQIGIIGAIGDCYSSISAAMVEDVYFKTGKELTALVKAESERLRAAGADFIVYSLHDGFNQTKTNEALITDSQLSSYYDPSLSDGYVDLVFEGHTHQRYVLYDSYSVYHVQASGENKGIGYVGIVINSVTGTHRTLEAEFVSSNVYKQLEPDSIVSTLLQKYEQEISAAYRVVGSNSAYRNSTYIKNLVARLYLELALKEWGNEYNIFLGGGFISVRSPYNLAAGDVKYGDLQMLLPFDNRLVLCSIKGSDLKSRFLENTNKNYYISLSTYGTSMRNSIDDNATYYIITDTYCSSYAWNRLTVVKEFTDGVYARDLVADYIANGGLN